MCCHPKTVASGKAVTFSQLFFLCHFPLPPLSQAPLLYPEAQEGFIFCHYDIQPLLTILCDTEKPPFGEIGLGGSLLLTSPLQESYRTKEREKLLPTSPHFQNRCGLSLAGTGRIGTTPFWAEQEELNSLSGPLTTGKSPCLLGSHEPPPYIAAGAQDKGPCSRETKRCR